MKRQHEATGRYWVGALGISIFGGYHFWPIIDPKGDEIATVLGNATAPPEDPTARTITQDRSREPAVKIVEMLNKLLDMETSHAQAKQAS